MARCEAIGACITSGGTAGIIPPLEFAMQAAARALFTIFVALFTIFVALVAPAHTQSWPQKPVKLLVPFGAGGNTDAIARIIAQHLGDAFGEPFVVENRPGAAGALATEAVPRAAPDGYTLFMASPSQIAITPALGKTRYDPAKDFAAISVIGTNPKVLAVHPGLPMRTLADFVAYVRARPNQVSYADSGTGSISHLSTVLLLKRAGLDMFAVRYKAATSIVSDIKAGHVARIFTYL